ncbi:MAG: Ger(x)C family spore germination protein [Halanaerobiaceae bacterium]
MIGKISIAILLLLIISLTGCWDQRDPENIALVLVGGYDYNPETDMYKIITQIESPLVAPEGGEGGRNDKPPYWTVSAWGYSPIDAVTNIKKKVSRRLSYSHMHLLILSETIAKEKGVVPVLDALYRTRESRPVLNIAVVSGDVEELLSTEIPIAVTNGLGLLSLINITEREIGTAVEISGREFINRLSRQGFDPVATHLELNKQKTDESSKENMHPPVKIAGLASFNDRFLSGFFNERETRGWKWIFGLNKIGFLNFPYPGEEIYQNLVTVKTLSVKPALIPEIDNNQPLIKIKIEAKGRIESITGQAEIGENITDLRRMEKRLAEVIRNDINDAVTRAKELRSDVFGFENAFYREKYRYWEMVDNKKDLFFLEVPVEIIVKTSIDSSGLVNKGAKIY